MNLSWFFPRCLSFEKLPRGVSNRVDDVRDMLVGVFLVQRQHEHRRERFVRARKLLAAVIDGLRTRQRERKPAIAERPLIANDLALESRLLDVPRRTNDVP